MADNLAQEIREQEAMAKSIVRYIDASALRMPIRTLGNARPSDAAVESKVFPDANPTSMPDSETLFLMADANGK